jgi:hypothetical protein
LVWCFLQLLAVVYSSFSAADKMKFRKLLCHKLYVVFTKLLQDGIVFPLVSEMPWQERFTSWAAIQRQRYGKSSSTTLCTSWLTISQKCVSYNHVMHNIISELPLTKNPFTSNGHPSLPKVPECTLWCKVAPDVLKWGRCFAIDSSQPAVRCQNTNNPVWLLLWGVMFTLLMYLFPRVAWWERRTA